MNCERNPGESLFEWKVRLCVMKLNKEIDLDWSEIVELLGLDCHYDSLRKASYGYKEYFDYLQENGTNNMSEDELLTKLEEKKLEIKKERVKLQTLRSDLNKKVAVEAKQELLYEEIINLIPRAKEVEFTPLLQGSKDKGYLLNFSDIHYDYFFKSETNTYSIEILTHRFNKLLGEVIWFVQKENVEELYVLNNGDSLSGLIHLNQLQAMQIGLVQSAIDFSRFMGEWLHQLSKYVKVKYLQVPTSNHSQLRIFDKSRTLGGEDLELLIINYIHDYLKDNPRVKVVVQTDKEYITFNLAGYNLIGYHGHQFKRVENVIEKLNTLHRTFYDGIILGHYHCNQEKTLFEGTDNNVELLIAPSIVGNDPYADGLLLSGKSSAKIHVYEKGKGRVQSNNIILN